MITYEHLTTIYIHIYFHPITINLFNSHRLSSLQCFFQPEPQRELSFLFFFFFRWLHGLLSFHPRAKVVIERTDRIGRSSRGSSSIPARYPFAPIFQFKQEFDAQTVFERSEFRERHPSNSLQPGTMDEGERWIAPSIDPVSKSVTEKRILVEIGPARHRVRGTGAGRFGHGISQYHHRPRLCALSPAHVLDRREIWKFFTNLCYGQYYCYALHDLI